MPYSRREWARILYSKEQKSRTLSLLLGLGPVVISFIIQMLLICSGVHPNPGPVNIQEHCDISICHVNIRSLKHLDKFGNLDKLTHLKCTLGGKFQIITLSETWLSRADSCKKCFLEGNQEPFQHDCD